MDITIYPTKLQGCVSAIPSKSHAHRVLICAALSDSPTFLECPDTNADIEATVGCLNALGAQIIRKDMGYYVAPIQSIPQEVVLDCGESGSTLRFILPIVCALGVDARIRMSGRLPERPLSPLWEELIRMGCSLWRSDRNTICTHGKLLPGTYNIAGNVSSQFISGLLFALAILDGKSTINIIGTLESKPYVLMTLDALSAFGVTVEGFQINGSYPFKSPKYIKVEGDWSNAAFFLTAHALGNDICVNNLEASSQQGDHVITEILTMNVDNPTISVKDTPDLVPILAVYFSVNGGAIFTDAARLRLKESDRINSVMKMLTSLGIDSECTENTLTIKGGHFSGGTVDACNDHRIAMAAAIAATMADGPVRLLGAECVAKSYPSFWDEYKRLGGNYEQYIW